MPSTFFGMEIGRRALSTSQLALNVVGQNTANVGTAGHSRQDAVIEETDPYGGAGADAGSPAQLGTGVTVASVNRVRDDFIDKQLYAANSDQGALDNLRDILGRVESGLGEPGGTGIGSQLTKFFNSFSDLSAAPDSTAVRATVLSNAQQLVSAFHGEDTSLSQIGSDIRTSIAGKVGDVNTLAAQIAALNKQIGQSQQSGDHPNDLLDKRTALVTQLSGLVDVQVIDGKNSGTGQPSGQIRINVGGFTLVHDDTSDPLPVPVVNSAGKLELQASAGQPIPLKGGEIEGLIQASGLVDGYRADFNKLASSVVSSVNAIHAAGAGLDGVTGRAFFTGKGAGDISVATGIIKDVSTIAAAAPPVPPAKVAPGNGDNARALATLTSQPAIGALSLNQYFDGQVATIGADSQRFQAQASTQDKVVTQLQNQQASVSGVNLDEEMTKLLQYQRAYQAAARIINVQDDIVNLIINGLGIGAATGA